MGASAIHKLHKHVFALGFINSLFAMELVLFIERTFELQIPNEELTLDNFCTIAAMAGLVGRQLAGTARSAAPQ